MSYIAWHLGINYFYFIFFWGGGVDGFLGSWFNSKIYVFVVVYGSFECLWVYSGTHVSMGNGFLQSMVISAVLIFYPMFNSVKRILTLKDIRRP